MSDIVAGNSLALSSERKPVDRTIYSYKIPIVGKVISPPPNRIDPPGRLVRYKGSDKRIYTYSEDGKLICGANYTKKDGICRTSPLDGRNRCRLHGGKSLIGAKSPRAQTLKYSIAVPSRMLQKYEEAQRDPDLISMRDEIAILQVRLNELLQRVDTSESGVLWLKAQEYYDELKAAMQRKDFVDAVKWVSILGKALNKGTADHLVWSEIATITEQMRKIKDSERKRLTDMKQMWSAEQAMAFVGYITASIKKHVKDPSVLAAISQDISSFISSRRR